MVIAKSSVLWSMTPICWVVAAPGSDIVVAMKKHLEDNERHRRKQAKDSQKRITTHEDCVHLFVTKGKQMRE